MKKIAETKEFDKKFIELQLEKKYNRLDTLKQSVDKTNCIIQKLVKDSNPAALSVPPTKKIVQKVTPADYTKGIEAFMIKLIESGVSDEEIVDEVGKYMQLYSTEVEKQINHLRDELEYEKVRQQQSRKHFLDQITNRSELETFFFECLGEMRKEILHKGPRGLVQQDPLLARDSDDNKLDASKYQALQGVLSNDMILIRLFDEIFGPPVKRQGDLPALPMVDSQPESRIGKERQFSVEEYSKRNASTAIVKGICCIR